MRALMSVLAVLLSFFSEASAQPANAVVDSSRIVGGERVLEQSVVVAAEIGEAWRAFATAEGFRTWAAPTTRIDLRVGAGETVAAPRDLEPALRRAFDSGVPYLVNVLTDPEDQYPRSANLA